MGLLVLGPVVLAALGGGGLLVALAVTAVRSRELPRSVAAARRHGAVAGALAVVGGLAAELVLVAGDLAGPLGSGVSALLAPLVFAVAHTAVLLVGEATWPRPRGALRSAALAVRTTQQTAPRWLLRTTWAAAGAVAVLATTGWVTAAPDGRSVALGHLDPSVEGSWSTAAGPYPGPVFAVPALVGLAVVALLVLRGLALVVCRPAVDGASAAEDAVLRRASAHRLLRGACAALLATAGGLALFGGTALHRAAATSPQVADGTLLLQPGYSVLEQVGVTAAVLGGTAALAGLAVLLAPAPRLAPAPPRPASRAAARAA